MAKFKFYLESPKEDGKEIVLDYDNDTSELRFDNGDIVVPQSEYRDWKPFYKMDEGKRQLKTIKIQLGLKCNYSCEYCSQRFVPRNPDDTYAHQDESEKTANEIEEFVNKESRKIEITTLTSLPKLDPVKQTKYDQMLSQLSSDVIPPAPKKPNIQEKPKMDAPKVMEQNVTPLFEDKPEPVVEQITKPVTTEMPKPIVELPEESDIDDDDDDIEQIKSKILKTLSKIEQAEVD